jgi:hypothetical protein
MTKWLSNNWNLICIYTLCSLLIGMVLHDKITFTEFALIYILMSVCTFVVFVMGISRGLLLAYIERDSIDNLLKKIIKISDDEDKTE